MKKPPEEYEKWFEYAEDDLKFAKVGLREGFYQQVCLHSQQAAEKSLKGYIIYGGKKHPRTHSLVDLASLINEEWLKTYIKPLQMLDEFYLPTRYPDALSSLKPANHPTKKDASDAISWAENIYQAVLENIHK